jgi:hypothetical protein
VTPGELQRLRAEIESDRGAFEARVAELEALDLDANDAGSIARAAVALHHAYGAVEAALSRLARTLEGSVPAGADWHQQLLHSMALAIPEVRPAFLAPETYTALRKLLAFRHFFRHAYAVSLDRAQLADLRRVAVDARGWLGRDLDAADAFLAELATALRG